MPTYLGVKLDIALTYRHHLEVLRKKLSTRVALLRRLAGSAWGAGTKTLRTAPLSLIYSTAEYCAPVWCRSTHTRLIDSVLNDTLRIVIGCLHPTPTDDLPVPAPTNSRLNVVVRSPTPFGLGRNGCWPSRGSQLPQALSFIFSLCCPLNDRIRAAHSFFKTGGLFSLFLFSCFFLALLRLLILLLFLMSGNVHPNPDPIFPCSVFTGNVTWRGKSV